MRKSRMLYEIGDHNEGGSYWNTNDQGPRSTDIVGALFGATDTIFAVEDTASKMLTDYFEMEASKATPQYGFRKGLNVFKQEGYEAAVSEL